MTGTPRSLEDLFHRATELPPEQREAFVTQQCGDDAALKERVLALLRQDARGTQHQLAGDAGALIGDAEAKIGRYTIVRELGTGGMGTVFLAQQSEPVHRLVAIKKVRADVGSEQVARRFELERQALALMNHPSIAQIYDGATTEDGSPYFVMEYVDGPPLTGYGDQRRLDWRQRLELFHRICSAVHHAHQKGIVHRDLKPNNVLVTEASGAPLPKIIDFGIAGAVALAPSALLDARADIVGSLDYMSPEQADPARQGVDARSDIYSLGVLMFELLVGVLPAPPRGSTTVDLTELRRVMRDDPPVRMADRWQQLPAETRAGLAASRSTTPAAHLRLLQGDLSWIACRAMAKDPNERYASASELAADVHRCLQGDVVTAVPWTLRYGTRIFLQQHSLLVALASLLLLSLVGGLAAVTLSLVEAHDARTAAVGKGVLLMHQLEESRGIGDFFDVMLFHADPMLPPGRRPGLRDLIDSALPEVDRMFGDRPTAEAAVRAAVGHACLQLGDAATAVGQLERAWMLLESTPDADRFEVFQTLHRLLLARSASEHAAAAEARIADLLRLAPGALRGGDGELRAAIDALTSRVAAPDSGGVAGELEEAVVRYRALPRSPDDARVFGIVLYQSAVLLQARGKLPEAVRCIDELERLSRETLAGDIRLLPLLRMLAVRWLLLGRFEEAWRSAEDLIAAMEESGRGEHWLANEARSIRAAALIGLNDFDTADDVLAAWPARSGARPAAWGEAVCGVLETDGRLVAFLRRSAERWAAGTAVRWWVVDSGLPKRVLEVACAAIAPAARADGALRPRAAWGGLLLRTGQAGEARDVLAPLVARGEPDPDTLADFAIACYRTEHHDEAMAAHQRLRELAASAAPEGRARADRALARVATEVR